MERWKLPEKTQDSREEEEKALNCKHKMLNEEKERKALNSKYEILNEEGEEEKAETLKAEMKRKMLYVRSYLGREDEMRTSQH